MPKKHNIKKRQIKALETDRSFRALYPLIKQLNPSISRQQFETYLVEARASGYRCFGVYQGKKLVAACGVWTMTRFWCGKFIEVDNLIVDEDQRNAGIGKLLLDWVEQLAKREKCQIVLAASYSHNHASHRFYLREKYIIKGFVFVKSIPE